VELLRDGMPAVSPGPAPKRSTARKLASPLDRDGGDHELLGQVTDYYHRVLKESPDALGYLQRGGSVTPRPSIRSGEQRGADPRRGGRAAEGAGVAGLAMTPAGSERRWLVVLSAAIAAFTAVLAFILPVRSEGA
jgi:hypothetical protein